MTPGKGTGGVGAAAPRADQGILGVRAKRPATRAERRRGFLRWLLTGERPEPSPSRLGVLEPFNVGEEKKVGICCSGGGIRSAAFNLGALQALRHDGELEGARSWAS